MTRLQAIDIGTNSVRSVVVEVADDGTYRVIDDEKETTRLGVGLHASGALDESAMTRTAEALKAMLRIGADRGATEVRAIGTAAMRMARNGDLFADRLAEQLGLEVDIVSEEEEGRLVFLSALANFELRDRSAIVDIGGGSVEIVQAVGEEIESVVSMRLGARVLADEFVDRDPISESGFKRMKRHARRTIRDRVDPPGEAVGILVGSGGTVTSIAAILAAQSGREAHSPHGYEITRAEVMQLLSELSRSSAEERRKISGLSPDRVDIILPGTLVLAEVMKLFGVTSVFVNGRGIREGIVIDAVRRSTVAARSLDRREITREFGARLHYDEQHAEQVCALALALFDQLAGPLALERQHRPLLETAAVLHDVGYYISYDRHHKHSYHLIANAALPGFTLREMRMVAAIARYHTKALPKSRHEAFAPLARKDREIVEQLAAVLRIADGLDRGRRSLVREVEVSCDDHAMHLVLRGAGDMRTEVYGVEKKRDLFERVFGLGVTVEPANSDVELAVSTQ